MLRGCPAVSLCASSPSIIFLSLSPVCLVHGGLVLVFRTGFFLLGAFSCCVLFVPLEVALFVSVEVVSGISFFCY